MRNVHVDRTESASPYVERLDAGPIRSIEEVARQMKMSRQTTHNYEVKALWKLYNGLAKEYGFPTLTFPEFIDRRRTPV